MGKFPSADRLGRTRELDHFQITYLLADVD